MSFLRPCRPSRAPRLRGATSRREGGRSSAALAGHRRPSAVSWPAVLSVHPYLELPARGASACAAEAGPNALFRSTIAAPMGGDRLILFANSIFHLTNDGAVTVIAGQITVLQSLFAFGPFETGLLTGTALLVTAVFQVLFGAMSDRRDPSRFLPLGILILGVGTLFVASATSFLLLVVIVAVSRIGASFYHPVGIAWIGREFQGEALDRSMGFQSSFGDTGVILGMATSALIAVSWGWQSPFLLWGGINLAAVALGVWLVRGRHYPPKDAADRREYRSLLRDVRPWLFPLSLVGAGFSIVTAFGPPLLKYKFGLGDASASVSIALWILAGAIVAFFFGRVSKRFGRFRTLAASYALFSTACFVGAAAGELAIVLAAFWTLGSALFVTYPALFAFASETSQERLRGTAFGVILGFQLLGGSLGSYAAGSLAASLRTTLDLEWTAPFYLLGALVLAGFVYLFAIRRKVANTRSPATATSPPR